MPSRQFRSDPSPPCRAEREGPIAERWEGEVGVDQPPPQPSPVNGGGGHGSGGENPPPQAGEGGARSARVGAGAEEETGGVLHWLAAQPGIGKGAARQIVDYLAAAQAALGVLPTQDT